MSLGLNADELQALGESDVFSNIEVAREVIQNTPEALAHLTFFDGDKDIRLHQGSFQKAFEQNALESGIIRTVANMIAANNDALLSDLTRLGLVDESTLED